jgi:acido-empty-quinoprotein group A
MNRRSASLLMLLTMAGAGLLAQGGPGLDPNIAQAPPTDAWPTYHGDYSGRHFSPLKQVTTANVKGLSLAWVFRTTASTQDAVIGRPAGAAATPAPAAAGGGQGFGPQAGAAPGATIKAIPIMFGGRLYLSTPNHVYAVDARTGAMTWHYVWQGRNAIGNRGVGMFGNWLFVATPDNGVVSLEAETGRERWNRKLVGETAVNFSTSAPVVIRNHVIVGVGGDGGGSQSFVEALDPETGASQWKWYTTPHRGEPGIETWPNAEASEHSAGGPWQPPTYDPVLNLLYVTTGQPTPTYNGKSREGANLYTCSVVALNPDTGKMAWYYQFSPHDTHDWDATQNPILIDGVIDGQARKLLAVTNRNGYFFLLDRTTGKSLVVTPFAMSNSYLGVDSGSLVPNPAKEGAPGGTLVFPDSDGAANYPSPSFSPETGLFYANATDAGSIFYLPKDASDPTGYGRGSEWHVGLFSSRLMAIDYRTGKVRWQQAYPELAGFWSSTHPGVLTTAGGLLFSGDPSGNFIAFDAATGKPLWHAALGASLSNTPQTFTLDGRQYVVVAAGDTLFGFALQ